MEEPTGCGKILLYILFGLAVIFVGIPVLIASSPLLVPGLIVFGIYYLIGGREKFDGKDEKSKTARRRKPKSEASSRNIKKRQK